MNRYVQLAVHGDTARIVLDRSERANALGPEVVEALHQALCAADDAGVALVVVEARGRAFCGGLDLADLETLDDAALLHRLVRVQLLLERVATMHALTVAVVEAPAVGAGADLVLACAVRLATGQASLRFPGAGFGAVLGTARLAALTSPSYAAEVALTGRRVGAPEAGDLSLLRVLRDRAAIDAEVRSLATSAAVLPDGTGARLRAAAAPCTSSSDALADLVRSLVSEPGLADRVRAYRARTSPARTSPQREGVTTT